MIWWSWKGFDDWWFVVVAWCCEVISYPGVKAGRKSSGNMAIAPELICSPNAKWWLPLRQSHCQKPWQILAPAHPALPKVARLDSAPGLVARGTMFSNAFNYDHDTRFLFNYWKYLWLPGRGAGIISKNRMKTVVHILFNSWKYFWPPGRGAGITSNNWMKTVMDN